MSLMISEMSRTAGRQQSLWFLCGPVASGGAIQHIPVDDNPFIVGRGAGISLRLQFKTVSGNHASIKIDNQQLIVEDLGSTNGTYVNGKRITSPTPIGEEDLVHFAEAPFRVRCQSLSHHVTGTLQEDICDQALALVQFDRLMAERLVVPHFQPIVQLSNAAILGHEVLGRGKVFGLESVGSMFNAAAQLNLEVELSQLLRWEGVRIGRGMCDNPMLFVNTHPKEMQVPGLVHSLVSLREMAGSTPIVLEIHEAAITCVSALNDLTKRLNDLNIEMAYDDFGAGQARLAEIVGARPKYVKFDIGLIRDINNADPNRMRMVQTLVTMVNDLGILSLAEGIETAAEAETCCALGFNLAQGYYYGYPIPATITGNF
jgi:EAL domain-containing protein (putative c-di-GMP-specific phosphodiesterase class I)